MAVDVIALTRALIAIDTCDPHGNEAEAARLVQSVLAEHGIAAELHEIAPGRANLVARIKGTGERAGIAFSAHMDTIGVDRARWSREPFAGTVESGKLYGRGSADMKGGLAAMVAAAIDVAGNGMMLKGDLLLAFSAAENSDCLGARELLKAGHFKGIGALLISEPSGNRVLVSEKGALWLRAVANGEGGHAAFREGEDGDRGNAIIRLARFLARVPELRLPAPPHRHLNPPTINVGRISGGISAAMTPSRAEAVIDVRMVPGLTPEQVIAALKPLAGPHVTIEVIDHKPFVDTPDDHPFVQTCLAAAHAEMDERLPPGGVAYYSDGAVIAPALDLPMVIIGPGTIGMSGADNEYVEVDKLLASRRIFSRVAATHLA